MTNGAPWPIVFIALGFGIIMIFLGNLDRVIWYAGQHGERVSGQIVEQRAERRPRDATYLTYYPTVAFEDPSGQARVMEVARGSMHYEIEVGTDVSVFWRAERGEIALDIPFQRRILLGTVLWVLTGLGCGMIWLAGWMAFGGMNRPSR